MSTLTLAVVTLAVTLLAVPVVRRAMNRLEIVDTPNARSSHSGVIPRGGGIAIAIAMLLSLTASGSSRSLWVVATGAAVLGVIGFVDDRSDLTASARLAAQVVVAGIASSIVIIESPTTLTAVAAVLIASACLVGYVNAFNFMDGINGISAAQAICAGGAFVVLGVLRDTSDLVVGGALLVAAFVGFLPFNAPTASIFLGDVGSYFAGFWIGGLVLIAVRSGAPLETALVPVVLWLTDTGITLLIRVRNGQRLAEAHRDHAYQRLARAWRSHGVVAVAAATIIATTSSFAILARDATTSVRAAVLGISFAISIGFVAIGRRAESSIRTRSR